MYSLSIISDADVAVETSRFDRIFQSLAFADEPEQAVFALVGLQVLADAYRMEVDLARDEARDAATAPGDAADLRALSRPSV